MHAPQAPIGSGFGAASTTADEFRVLAIIRTAMPRTFHY